MTLPSLQNVTTYRITKRQQTYLSPKARETSLRFSLGYRGPLIRIPPSSHSSIEPGPRV
jgi:hypothetical protein